jgi:hypothetical protein
LFDSFSIGSTERKTLLNSQLELLSLSQNPITQSHTWNPMTGELIHESFPLDSPFSVFHLHSQSQAPSPSTNWIISHSLTNRSVLSSKLSYGSKFIHVYVFLYENISNENVCMSDSYDHLSDGRKLHNNTYQWKCYQQICIFCTLYFKDDIYHYWILMLLWRWTSFSRYENLYITACHTEF